MKKPLCRHRSVALLALGFLLLTLAAACVPVKSLGGCPPNCPYTLSNTNALAPTSTEAVQIKQLFNLILILAAIIFVVVEGMLLFAVIRFRGRRPEAAVQIHGNTRLEIAWTSAPAVILAVLLGFTLKTMGDVKAIPTGNVVRVKAIGHQWWWEFRYPALNIITADELIVPLESTIDVTVETVDVVHGFWVPELFGKVDAIPGYVTRVRFTPLAAGIYGGQCTQFCGAQHGEMRFAVIVKTLPAFRNWRDEQQKPVAEVSGAAAEGKQIFLDRCRACHTINGVSDGQIGPNLTHLMSRDFIAGGILRNTPHNLGIWLADPQKIKPGILMRLDPPLTDADENALVAYLTTLQ